MCRTYPTSIGASYYEFRLLCGILRDDIEISDSNEDDVDTGHGASVQHNLKFLVEGGREGGDVPQCGFDVPTQIN
jgi:hypothetical protein